MRLVGGQNKAEPRDAVLVRRLAVAVAEYDGVPVGQQHFTRSKRLLNSRSGPLSGQAGRKPIAAIVPPANIEAQQVRPNKAQFPCPPGKSGPKQKRL